MRRSFRTRLYPDTLATSTRMHTSTTRMYLITWGLSGLGYISTHGACGSRKWGGLSKSLSRQISIENGEAYLKCANGEAYLNHYRD